MNTDANTCSECGCTNKAVCPFGADGALICFNCGLKNPQRTAEAAVRDSVQRHGRILPAQCYVQAVEEVANHLRHWNDKP